MNKIESEEEDINGLSVRQRAAVWASEEKTKLDEKLFFHKEPESARKESVVFAIQKESGRKGKRKADFIPPSP